MSAISETTASGTPAASASSRSPRSMRPAAPFTSRKYGSGAAGTHVPGDQDGGETHEGRQRSRRPHESPGDSWSSHHDVVLRSGRAGGRDAKSNLSIR